MKKYLLFDLDGTLTDSKLGVCTCVQYALDSFGIREPDLDKLECFIGPPLQNSFMEFYQMDEAQAHAAIAKYRERYRDKGIFENSLYEGIPAMLRTLHAEGMVLAVASSKPEVFVRQILEHFKIAKYFRVIVGSELDGTRSDKGEVVSEALRRLFDGMPIERNQVYMIGDRKFDVEGAHSLGVECVGVTYGYGSMEELKGAKSDYIVRSVEELRRFLLRGAEKKPGFFPVLVRAELVFLLFFVIRYLVQILVTRLLMTTGEAVPGMDFLLEQDEKGVLGLTRDAAMLARAAGSIVGVAAIFRIAQKIVGRTAEDMQLQHLQEEPRRHYVMLGAACVGLALGGNLLLELSGAIRASEAYGALAQAQYAVSLPLGLVYFGFITPLSEELLFRGIFHGAFRRFLKLPLAMLASAALFAIYHGNIVQGVYAFVMGGLIVYAYEYFGDFRMPVYVHMLANLLIYLLSYTGAASVLVSWPVCLAFLACGAGGVWLLHREKNIF